MADIELTENSQKVSDLTVGELKKLIREIVEEMLVPIHEYIYEIEDQMPDPDEGKPFNEEFMAGLEEDLQIPLSQRKGTRLEDALHELGIDD